MRASIRLAARSRVPLLILQQSLDVVEFDLRALRIGQPAAQFFQDPAHPLHVNLAGNFLRHVVAEFAPVQRPAERIVGLVAALLPAGARAGPIALPLAVALLHRLREALGALAQRIERLSLRIHRTIGIAFAKPTAGIAHRAIGFAEAVLPVAGLTLFARLTLFALLAALAFLTALALAHAAFGQFLLQFLQPVAQALLI